MLKGQLQAIINVAIPRITEVQPIYRILNRFCGEEGRIHMEWVEEDMNLGGLGGPNLNQMIKAWLVRRWTKMWTTTDKWRKMMRDMSESLRYWYDKRQKGDTNQHIWANIVKRDANLGVECRWDKGDGGVPVLTTSLLGVSPIIEEVTREEWKSVSKWATFLLNQVSTRAQQVQREIRKAI